MAATSGAPIEFVISTPSPVLYSPGAISALAPHPNAAKLWQDWGMSKEGQSICVDPVSVLSARTDVPLNWAAQQPWFFEDVAANALLDWSEFGATQKEVIARFEKDIQGG